MPVLQVPPKLEKFSTIHKRFKIAFGGRGGGKSQTYAGKLLRLAQVQHYKIGCFREYQNSIDDSVHALLAGEVRRLGLKGFKVLNNRIVHKRQGEFRFKGLARNPESVKSMYGFNIFWLEEAQAASMESLRLLTPTLRTPGSEVWMSLNPMSSADAVSVRFLEPFMEALLEDGVYEDDLHYIVWLNYYDNPWFPKELDEERVNDYETLSRAEYNHIWLGHYNDEVENAVIPAEWFDAALDAHIKLGFAPRGIRVLAFDPADQGADAKAYAIRHGSVFTDVESTHSGDVNDGCDWAVDKARNSKIDLFTWDCDGLGVSLSRQVRDSFRDTRTDYTMFKGSNTPERPNVVYSQPGYKSNVNKQRTNKEVFKNKRAQFYWMLRDRFYNTYRAVEKNEYVDPDKMISLCTTIPNINKLRAEVCRVPRKYNPNGMIQICSKEEMRRLKIKSPNMADCLMMALTTPDDKHTGPDLEFKSLW